MSGRTIHCRRCDEDAARLEKTPFRMELGERIQAGICHNCRQDWLRHQTLLINPYGLDPREAGARKLLFAQIEEVLLGGGPGKEVDAGREDSIEW